MAANAGGFLMRGYLENRKLGCDSSAPVLENRMLCAVFCQTKINYMKVKLLKRLRQIGRDMVNVSSVTTTCGLVTGMCYGYDTKEYSDLFELGDTEEDVKNKACKIYLETNIEKIRKKYRKYSRVCR